MSNSSPENFTVVLNPAVVAFVQREAAANGGIDASEFVNQVLAAAEKKRAKEILEKLLVEGMESGEPIPVTPEYWEKLDAEVTQIISAAQRPNAST